MIDMQKSTLFQSFWRTALMILFTTVLFSSCKKSPIVELTSEDVNITGYLDKYPDQFSEFRAILERTKTSGFLQAYGAYTIFLPTNDAVKAYLSEKQVSSINDISEKDLYDLVTLHVVEDSIKTVDFVDGKLRNASMSGQYLVTVVKNEGGTSKISVNTTTKITQANISVGNGIIHIVDHVLTPATKTVAQTVETDPRFTIFAEALKETGLYSRLNIAAKANPVVAEKYLTVFAETNAALAAAGFNSYAELKAAFSNTADPANPENGLYQYVAYHIVPDARFFVDMLNPGRLNTLTVKGISILPKSNDKIVINEVVINDVTEPGAAVVREAADINASNGVVHAVANHFKIINRPPAPLYLDLADQPEFRRLSVFTPGRGVATWNLNDGKPQLQYIKLDKQWVEYDSQRYLNNAYRGDVLRTPLVATEGNNATTRSARAERIEFITPYMSPGRYKFWVCYPRTGLQRNTFIKFSFNGLPLGRTVNMQHSSGFLTETAEVAEANGYKRYMGPSTITIDQNLGRLLGVVTVTEEGPQVILLAKEGAGSFHSDMWIDMIHLIPEKEEQLWPRFWANGRVQQQGEPD